MKKIIVTGVMAFCLIALTRQEASAWVNSRFSIGLNMSQQSGGNSFFWGLWRDGQLPGPEAYGGLGANPYGAPPYGAGMQFGGLQGYPQSGFAQQTFQGAASPSAIGSMNQGSPYQFANYPRQVQYYTPNTWSGNR